MLLPTQAPPTLHRSAYVVTNDTFIFLQRLCVCKTAEVHQDVKYFGWATQVALEDNQMEVELQHWGVENMDSVLSLSLPFTLTLSVSHYIFITLSRNLSLTLLCCSLSLSSVPLLFLFFASPPSLSLSLSHFFNLFPSSFFLSPSSHSLLFFSFLSLPISPFLFFFLFLFLHLTFPLFLYTSIFFFLSFYIAPFLSQSLYIFRFSLALYSPFLPSNIPPFLFISSATHLYPPQTFLI